MNRVSGIVLSLTVVSGLPLLGWLIFKATTRKRRQLATHDSLREKKPTKSGNGTFAAFVSHFKREAALEARWIQTELQGSLDRRVFLDSDDLRDLSSLRTHVLESDCLVLVQSRDVLTRPYCILELLWAVEAGKPIVGVNLDRHSFPYDFAKANDFLSHLDTALAEANPSSLEVLKEHGVTDIKRVAYELANRLPRVISVELNTCASRAVLQATTADLVSAISQAKALQVPMAYEDWLRHRAPRAIQMPTSPHAVRSPDGRHFQQCVSPRGVAVSLDDPVPCLQLEAIEDLPALDSDIPLVINGGYSVGPDCPLEACCSFCIGSLMSLKAIGVDYRMVVMDLNKKPEWLASIVGHAEASKMSTPMMHHKGKWLIDSADIIAALPEWFPEAPRHVFVDPPYLPPEAISSIGPQTFFSILKEKWKQSEDHPMLHTLEPFEEALAKAPFLSGEDKPCIADLRVAGILLACLMVDQLINDKGKCLDSQKQLPNFHRWLFDGLVPLMVEEGMPTGLRLQLLLATGLSKKMPALAALITEAKQAELDHARELAAASATEIIPF